MRVDEMPDVFVADLRRLLELAGHVPTDDDRDPVLLEQFCMDCPRSSRRSFDFRLQDSR